MRAKGRRAAPGGGRNPPSGVSHHRRHRRRLASWYANWLLDLSELPDLPGTKPIRSHLVAALVQFVPEQLVNQLTLAIVVTYAGPEDEARRAAAPLIELGPAGQMIAEMFYADLNSALDDPPGYRNYWSAEHLDSFPDPAVDAFCARAIDMVVPSASQHVLFPMGGAGSRGAAGFPIPWRQSNWVVHPFGLWTDPADDERAIRWTRDVRADVHPWASGAVYLNFIDDEGTERVVAGLGQDNYDRLAGIKARYDPDNVFHLNHNVVPIHPSPAGV